MSRFQEREARFLSRPVELHWAGWRTTTHDLQRAGWDISAHQDIARMQMGIALRAPNGIAYGVSQNVDWQYMEEHHGYGLSPIPLGAHMKFGKDVLIHHSGPVQANYYSPVDAVPQFTETRRSRLEDFAHFANAPLVRNNPIVIPEESVSELMERILKMQQPGRTARIRESLRNPDGFDPRSLPEQKFHAQIISFGKAA